MKSINVGIIGLGTIGSGLCEALSSNSQLIKKRTGLSIELKGVCDVNKAALSRVSAAKNAIKTTNADDLVNDKDIDIIVELIGGINPAKDIILRAMAGKKHIVTANKALLSQHWKEIFASGAKNRVFVNFEAAVGGAIPIIRTLRESFVAENIDTIYGILNGTTNFILTEMSEKNYFFEEALKVAQEKGIAEKDPELDISGQDSAHKLVILSLLGFGVDVSVDDIYTEGIRGIDPQDIYYAERWGYSVKLLAIAKKTSGALELRVHPVLLEANHLLSDVRGTDNAVFVKGELIGESLLFGKGAGEKPTSNSVLADIVEIARHVGFVGEENPYPYNFVYDEGTKKIKRIEDLNISYYLRFSVIDKCGVLAAISSVLAENNISIANVSQEERKEGETVPVIILTHKAAEGNMQRAIGRIDRSDYITAKTVAIRIEG